MRWLLACLLLWTTAVRTLPARAADAVDVALALVTGLYRRSGAWLAAAIGALPHAMPSAPPGAQSIST